MTRRGWRSSGCLLAACPRQPRLGPVGQRRKAAWTSDIGPPGLSPEFCAWEIDAMRAATHLPLLVGSGVTEANVAQILSQADGVIVASSLKEDGVWWNPVAPGRLKRFVDAAGR